MCIIVYKPAGISVDRQTLEICFANNPDGAGFMYPCERRLLIQKGYFEAADFIMAWEKCLKLSGDGLPIVFHFRIATAGEIDKRNCHPHRIAYDLGFVHNGILSRVHVPKESVISDTIIYRNRYLGNLTGASLLRTKLFKAIGRHIGTGNKFVFMNGEGKTIICNEDQGIWRDGLWFSNHSFLPRRVFPFASYYADWFCEDCGRLLDTPAELAEGLCLECLERFEAGFSQCTGCFEPMPSIAHRELGWCDTCGFDIYGRKWPDMLRGAAEARERDGAFPEWF